VGDRHPSEIEVSPNKFEENHKLRGKDCQAGREEGFGVRLVLPDLRDIPGILTDFGSTGPSPYPLPREREKKCAPPANEGISGKW